MKKLVSVVIPTYNRSKSILAAIDSVLNQSYVNTELIIVDDGSSDNTKDIVENISDPRIKYLKNNINKGASAARNYGIKIAKGEYIAFQDSDDIWHPNKLELQVETIENSPFEAGVVYCGLYRIQGQEKNYFPPSNIRNKEGFILDTLKKQNLVGTQTALIKQECFKTSGYFDESFPRLQDWELFIRISKFYKFAYIDKPLVTVYHSSDSISASPNKLIVALELMIKKHSNIYNDAVGKDALNYIYRLLGDLYLMNDDVKNGKKYLYSAIRLAPYKIRGWLEFMFSFMPKRYYIKSIHALNQMNHLKKISTYEGNK